MQFIILYYVSPPSAVFSLLLQLILDNLSSGLLIFTEVNVVGCRDIVVPSST
jgi:hypothetical protein